MREGMRRGTEHTYHGDIRPSVDRVGHTATALCSLGNARKRQAGVPGMVYDFTAAFLFNSVSLISFEVYNALLYVAVFALLLVPVCTYIVISKHGSMT
jgi:hypothetical protein